TYKGPNSNFHRSEVLTVRSSNHEADNRVTSVFVPDSSRIRSPDERLAANGAKENRETGKRPAVKRRSQRGDVRSEGLQAVRFGQRQEDHRLAGKRHQSTQA